MDDRDGRLRSRPAAREVYVPPRGRGPAKYSSGDGWRDGGRGGKKDVDDVEYGWSWGPVKKSGGGSYGASQSGRSRQQQNPYSYDKGGKKGKGKGKKGKRDDDAMETEDGKGKGKK